jgi:hypothetical protein
MRQKYAMCLHVAVLLDDGSERFVYPVGRDAWALANLIEAGNAGCTPIDNPGPRWSHYVFKLRHEYGLNIETIDEPHGGPYAGTHARYVLRETVRVIERKDAA